MRSSVATARVSTQPKSVGASLDTLKAKSSKVGMSWEGVPTEPDINAKTAATALIDEARILAGMTHKEMYLSAGVDKGTWSDAMSGGRSNFALHWLMSQPAKWWSAYQSVMSKKFNLDPNRVRDLRYQRICELAALVVEDTRVDR